jgi:hypothetical protein
LETPVNSEVITQHPGCRSVDTAAASESGEEIDEEPWALQFGAAATEALDEAILLPPLLPSRSYMKKE